ncbi:MAG: transcriptional regulator [Flavobacteriia bacterium]|nr:transcriptional regulator [Flavobacteriia bacterium]
MSIQNRLLMVLKMHRISASNFADSIGVQRSNVSHVLNGRNKPSLDFLEKTLKKYPRVNAGWLITGEVSKEINSDNLNLIDDTMDSTFENKLHKEVALDSTMKKIEKIIVFYTDLSFTEYSNK